MPSERVIWGPPGTGKTSSAVTLVRHWMDQGVPSEGIAFLAFTKSAAKAAAMKIFESEDESKMRQKFPYFRTLHSLCYMGLGKSRPDQRLVGPGDMKQFAKVASMDGAYAVYDWEELAEVYAGMRDQGRTEWDTALAAYQISRVKARSIEDLDKARVQPNLEGLMMLGLENMSLNVYQNFVEKYEKFKTADGLIDYTDMLEYGVREMKPFEDIQYVLLDECQDLAGIHHVLVDRILSGCDEIWWIGDDDQSIYKFSGASAELFLERSKRARVQHQLRQTHRFGQNIVDFSGKIIKRVVHRHPKEILAVSGQPGEIYASGQFEPMSGDVMVVHRHVQGCHAAAQEYISAGLPFRNERGLDPLGFAKRINIFETIKELAKGGTVTATQAALLVEEGMKSVLVGDRNERVRLLGKGAKANLDERLKGSVTLRDLMTANILTPEGASVIQEKDYNSLNFTTDHEYYERLTKNGYSLDTESYGKKIAKITTIHGSKGRQAEQVVIFAEMSNKCWDDYETEHRLAYVAATRTETNLIVCYQNKVGWARSEYDYPLDEKVSPQKIEHGS